MVISSSQVPSTLRESKREKSLRRFCFHLLMKKGHNLFLRTNIINSTKKGTFLGTFSNIQHFILDGYYPCFHFHTIPVYIFSLPKGSDRYIFLWMKEWNGPAIRGRGRTSSNNERRTKKRGSFILSGDGFYGDLDTNYVLFCCIALSLWQWYPLLEQCFVSVNTMMMMVATKHFFCSFSFITTHEGITLLLCVFFCVHPFFRYQDDFLILFYLANILFSFILLFFLLLLIFSTN